MNKRGKYIIKRGNRFHYQRRTPAGTEHILPAKFRRYIQITLKTDGASIAEQKAAQLTAFIDDYIEKNITKEKIETEAFELALCDLKRCGFKYKAFPEIITEIPLHEFVNRVNTAHAVQDISTKNITLGITKKPEIRVSDIRKILEEEERLALSKKNKSELRKWRNPIDKALNNFIHVIQRDAKIIDLTREDTLEFRRWWEDRIIEEGLTENSANRDIGNIRKGIRAASDRYSLDIPVLDMFYKVGLPKGERKKRRPFETEYIQDTLLTHNYKCKSPECRLLIFAMADTGCRIKELVGLEPEDIVLDADIPYINIIPNETRGLKTKPSKRKIPLVGAALYAFKHLPSGFIDYYNNNAGISATTNKYLKENDLLPTERHTVYSLRHSFEDRLTAVEPPDKIQAMLMGHKYNREEYGNGPSLKQKKKWLDKIAFEI